MSKQTTIRRWLGALGMISLGFGGNGCTSFGEERAVAGSELSVGDIDQDWRENGNVVPVCFASTLKNDDALLADLMSTIQMTWGDASGLAFSFEPTCPTHGFQKFLKVAVSGDSTGTLIDGVDGWSPLGMAATFRFPFQSPTVEIRFNADHTTARRRFVITHLIGHALGFQDEQNRPENAGGDLCALDLGPVVSSPSVTPYDNDSVMSACNAHEAGLLTSLDKEGVRARYGYPGSAIDVGIGTLQSRPWAIDADGRIVRWNPGPEDSGVVVGGNPTAPQAAWELMRSGSHIAIDAGPRSQVAWAIESDHDIVRFVSGSWRTIPGSGKDVGIGADGSVWLVTKSGDLARWTGSQWETSIVGGVERVDVGPHGDPWVVRKDGSVLRFKNGGFLSLSGNAVDIALSSNGEAFIVGVDQRIMSFEHSSATWKPLSWTDAAHRRISAGPAGQVAAVDDADRIYIRKRFDWPGQGLDIGLGADEGRPWVIGTSKRVFAWDEGAWHVIRSGDHIALDVGMVIDDENRIWKFQGDLADPRAGTFSLLPGLGLDVGTNPAGDACIVGADTRLLCWDGTDWEPVRNGSHAAVDVGPDGLVWAADTSGQIYRSTLPVPDAESGAWDAMNGVEAIDIGIGANNLPYYVSASGNVFSGVDLPGPFYLWEELAGTLPRFSRVAGGPDGRAAVLGDDLSIWTFAWGPAVPNLDVIPDPSG